MNEEVKHHAKGLAQALKKAAEDFMRGSLPKDFTFDGEAKIKVHANGETYEKRAKYSADLSTKEISEEE